ncbi:MAG TPA: hypothetical protein VM869_35010 [Enhygromyxa sp.]|nr:hypothetical protein [Enhygromyxa sp.]
MQLRTILLSSLSLVLAAACHAGPQTTAAVELVAAPAPEPESEAAPAPEPSASWAVLERGVAHRAGMTEVVLDPRGEAALTLDAEGGVRLWPTLQLAAAEPYRIPTHEPLSLSLAKRGTGFTLAFIATNNAAIVYTVEQPTDGPATIHESFALSPEDPLLELHVLDGGERILALGVDHRVRLYSRDGELISQIDERGFGPWQLRVSGGVGEPPKLAAILAQPLRVQPLQLVDDRLAIAGPARAVELDRGPNLNDLALSPDGTTVAALRRADKHGSQWSIELIDLATDTRKLIAGRAASKVRPRMHFHANDRLLLEDGSGVAWIVELAQAVEPRKLDDLHPDSKLAKRLAKQLIHPSIALPASGERDVSLPDDDKGIRMHASVVNGVRASIDVTAGRRLVVGALDQPKALSLAHPATKLLDAGLDASGSTVVWVNANALYVEAVGGAEVTVHEHELGSPIAVAVPKRGRAAIVGTRKAGLIDLDSGRLRAASTIPITPMQQASSRFVSNPDKTGWLGFLSDEREPKVWLLHVSGSLQVHEASADELATWGDLRGISNRVTKPLCVEHDLACEHAELFARDHAGRVMVADARALHLDDGGSWKTIELPGQRPTALVPSPAGHAVAIAKLRENWRHEIELSLVDSESGELLWTQTLAHAFGHAVLRWSADGTRLAVVAGYVGQVLAVEDGALLHERTHLPLEVRSIDASTPSEWTPDPVRNREMFSSFAD